MSLLIRPFDFSDFPIVADLCQQIWGHTRSLPQHGWLALVDNAPIGLAWLFNYEGLPHLTAVDGAILPRYRRRGYGTALLTAVLADFPPHSQQELVAEVGPWDSPASHFLRHHGFTPEHEEISYERPATLPLPPLHMPPGYHVAPPRPIRPAHYTFTGLYRRAFDGYPWNQPYNPVNLDPQMPGLLLLYHDQREIGFAWTHRHPDGTGQIEPFGLVAEYQGQGHGRVLLLSALHHLYQQNIPLVRIITWANNHPARRLYERVGFTAVSTSHHLSRPI